MPCLLSEKQNGLLEIFYAHAANDRGLTQGEVLSKLFSNPKSFAECDILDGMDEINQMSGRPVPACSVCKPSGLEWPA